jgi:hypothetical protein
MKIIIDGFFHHNIIPPRINIRNKCKKGGNLLKGGNFEVFCYLDPVLHKTITYK